MDPLGLGLHGGWVTGLVTGRATGLVTAAGRATDAADCPVTGTWREFDAPVGLAPQRAIWTAACLAAGVEAAAV